MGSYSTAFELVFEAQKSLGKFTGDIEKLEQICTKVDDLAKEFESDYVDVEIDDIYGALILAYDCEEMVIHGSSHKLYEVANEASKLTFYQTREGLVRTEFAFVGLWERKNER